MTNQTNKPNKLKTTIILAVFMVSLTTYSFFQFLQGKELNTLTLGMGVFTLLWFFVGFGNNLLEGTWRTVALLPYKFTIGLFALTLIIFNLT